MTNLKKLKMLCTLIATKNLSPTQEIRLFKDVAKETGFSFSQVRDVYNAAKVIGPA
jgi:hypothetical protein